MESPTDYPLPRAERRDIDNSGSGLVCLLFGGIVGLIAGFLLAVLVL